MKKKIVSLLFVAILVPQLASAAWWNPFSWNKPKVEEKKVEVVATTTAESPVKEVIKEVPVYKDKVVEKTVTVQDPTLLTKITELTSQNADLKAKYDNVVGQLNACKADKVSVIQEPELSPACTAIKSDYDAAKSLVEKAELDWRSLYQRQLDIESQREGGVRQSLLDKIEINGKKSVEPLMPAMESLKQRFIKICGDNL